MHKRKSPRHVKAARSRWRHAEQRADEQREAGIADRLPITADARQPLELDLRSYGGPRLLIEPRAGYISVRAIDQDTGDVRCMALKSLLRDVADALPRTIGWRACM